MKHAEFYACGSNTKEFGGYTVQGYLDENKGWVRLSRDGELLLYYYADKTGKTWEGSLKLSTRAKEYVTKVCKILVNQIKAQ